MMADANLLQQSPFLDPEQQMALTELQRKQQLANILTQKGMELPQGQMVSGRYVAPSWTQQLSNLFNVYQGKNLQEQATKEQAALSKALREQQTKGLEEFISSGQAQPEQAVYGAGEEGPTKTITQAAQPALPYGQRIAKLTQTNAALGNQLLADMLKTQKVGEGETLVRGDLGTGRFETVGKGAEKLPTEYKEYQKAVEGGYKGSFFQYQQALKQAGAQPINVSMGKDFAGQIGEIVRESAGMARAAQQTIQSADKIINAADKAITGKGAEVRFTATQLADTLGVGGKDKEKLEKTRELVQETAKLAITAANNKGQGAVSDYERSLYNRAAGGDINLTPTELKLIANRAKEGAGYAIQSHQAKINAMKSNPETAQLVPYYDVAPIQQSPSVTQSNGGWSIKGVK